MSNIIIPSCDNVTGDGDDAKKLLKAIDDLSTHLSKDPVDDTQVSVLLKLIGSLCNVDLAYRCFAGSNGAFPKLVQCCDMYSSTDNMFLQSLDTMRSLLTGQPDLVNNAFIEFLVAQLGKTDTAQDVICKLLAVTVQACVMHEANRQKFVSCGLISTLTEILGYHHRNSVVVRDVCIALKTLTLDDDIRVPFGKAYDHSRNIVEDGNALDILFKAAKGDS